MDDLIFFQANRKAGWLHFGHQLQTLI